MEEVAVESWKQFKEQLEGLRQERRNRKEYGGAPPSDFLFRGQENACWNLSTTLERAGHENMRFPDYYKLIERIHCSIESLGYGKWNLRLPLDFDQALDEPSISFGKTPRSYCTTLRKTIMKQAIWKKAL